MEYNININNGTGSENIQDGVYNVTATANGYDNSSIDPSSVTITTGTDEYAFTIAATGTLTLHVTEDGTSGGTPVVGATFIRTDSSGNEYGSEITTDSNGDAVFNNVPFASSSAPTIYYKQKSSDSRHSYSGEVSSTSLESNTKTVEITNSLFATRTITLTDKNYQDLPIASATINLK